MNRIIKILGIIKRVVFIFTVGIWPIMTIAAFNIVDDKMPSIITIAGLTIWFLLIVHVAFSKKWSWNAGVKIK